MADQTPPDDATVERIMGEVSNAFADGAEGVNVPGAVVDRMRQGCIPIIEQHYSGWSNEDDREMALSKMREFGTSAATFARARDEQTLTVADFDRSVQETLSFTDILTPWCLLLLRYLGLRRTGGAKA